MTNATETAGGRRILLGQIGSAHGIRGDVMVRTYTADPASIAAYGPLTDKDGARPLTLSVVRVTDKGVVARIKGVSDRNAAELLRGRELYVLRAKLPDADEAEYYHADLIGLEAVTEDGHPFGRVIAVQNFGAGDLLEIRVGDSRDVEFIPFTNACVPDVDIAAGRLTVVPPVLTGEAGPDDREAEVGDASGDD
ncbi:MAG: ribosome maturation factor RimM [Hyphomicrobium sp.]|nr:ribosome maturation factor RimM [Hyphomicrobium sp.]